MDYLKIRNWHRWQTYRRDRGQPPWIKIHRCLMRDLDWVSLTDAQRGQLVSIWLLAADRDGIIPNSVGVLRKLCHMDADPDLKLFIELGFIEHDANVTPDWRQHDAPETEAETETEQHCINGDSVDTPGEQYANGKDFDRFWEHWPVKRNKKTARDAFLRKKFKPEDVDELIADVKTRIQKDPRWLEGVIMHCSTYLNGNRWEDDYVR